MAIHISAKQATDYNQVYNALTFVRLATNKNDRREFCNCVHYRDGILLGTDGHRLHKVEINFNDFLKNGSYEIVKLNKREIVLNEVWTKLPDYAWYLSEKDKGSTIVPESLPEPTEGQDQSIVYRLIAKLGIIEIHARDHGYNYGYLSDALYNGATEIHRNKDGLLIINSGDYTAAVMPMRL